MNYSFSLFVKCVAALHYCYLLSLFRDGYYSKVNSSEHAAALLLLCLLNDCISPPAVKIMSVRTHFGAKWYLFLFHCKFFSTTPVGIVYMNYVSVSLLLQFLEVTGFGPSFFMLSRLLDTSDTRHLGPRNWC